MTSAEGTLYASSYASRKVLQEARKAGKNILVFVHGYNNDITAILNRADHLEKAYGVIVVCFSWPARGGGARGTLSYREDKRDAKASIGGFERFLVIARNHLDDMNEGAKQAAMAKAEKEHPEDNERRDMRFQELMDKACPVKISMMLHSMGNYLLKHTIMSSTSAPSRAGWASQPPPTADVGRALSPRESFPHCTSTTRTRTSSSTTRRGRGGRPCEPKPR